MINIPILAYHEITAGRNISKELLQKMPSVYFVTEENFEQQMYYLKKEYYKVISLAELMRHLKNGSREHDILTKSVVITFDDGYEGNYKYALPILKKFRFSATFFITAGLINKPFMMNWDQLREMVTANMSIQAHTFSHSFLGKLSYKEVEKELRNSREILEERLGIKVEFMSLPHGSSSKYYEEISNKLGYLGGCSSELNFANQKSNIYFLPRIRVDKSFSIKQFASIITRTRYFFTFLYCKYKLKKLLKTFLGENFYDKIYNKLFGIKEIKF